jgi:hypothetical protein
MSLRLALAASVALCLSTAAHAALLSDNFDSGTPTLNWAGDVVFGSTSDPSNLPAPGSVDLIGSGAAGSSYDVLPGNGYYVDLDGTTGNGNLPIAGQLTSLASFGAGTYTLMFDLAGNQRVSFNQTTVVSLGSFSTSITPLAYTDPFKTYAFTFSTTGGYLQFTELGPSNQQGNLLDNVSLSAGGVPEPSTWAMLMLGLAGAGAMLRRRKQVAVTA